MKRSTWRSKESGRSTKSKSPKRNSPLRKRSKKTEKIYVERRKIVEKLLSERPWCEACPIFAKHDERVTYVRKRSQDIHELIRRSQGGSILDEKNLMAVCRPCHERIGKYPKISFELGLAKEGWKKNKS